jgi:hypothetical protein
MKRTVTISLALLLAVAGCGDDDAGGGGDVALMGDLAEQIKGGQTGDQLGLSDEDAVCFASGLIDALGGERMADALQLEFEEFMSGASIQERRTVVDAMFDCIDFGALMTQEVAGEISADAANCLGDGLAASDGFRDALTQSFGSADDPFEDPALLGELLPVVLECLSAEELIQLGGDS